MNKKTELFYKKLQLQLDDKHDFPCIYMFKFIVPSTLENIAKVEGMFDESAQLSTKESASKKYTSITIKIVMSSAEKIIEIYKQAHSIKGIIAL